MLLPFIVICEVPGITVQLCVTVSVGVSRALRGQMKTQFFNITNELAVL